MRSRVQCTPLPVWRFSPPSSKILLDAHAGEQAAPLRHVADAETRVLRGRMADQFSFGEPDRSVRGRRDADQGLEQRRLPGAVAAEQCDDFIVVQREIDIVEDVALAIERINFGGRQQRVGPGGGFARFGGDGGGTGADIDCLHLGAGAGILDRAVEQHTALIHNGDVVGEL